MAVTFPSIKPSSRSFAAAEYPVTVYKAQSGATVRRLWGSSSSNATLRLSFRNISDTDTTAILSAHQQAKGNFDSLTLPNELFDGASSALKQAMVGSGLAWRFAEGNGPTVETTFNGRSNVEVTLVGTL
jgi:hypothetical protein